MRQIHLAGHLDRGDMLIDTHGAHVVDPVWELYEWYIASYGGAPTMIEWDTAVPPWPELAAELEKIKAIALRVQAGSVQCA